MPPPPKKIKKEKKTAGLVALLVYLFGRFLFTRCFLFFSALRRAFVIQYFLFPVCFFFFLSFRVFSLWDTILPYLTTELTFAA